MPEIMDCACIDPEYKALLRGTLMHEELKIGGELEDAKRELRRVERGEATIQEEQRRTLNEHIVRIMPSRLIMLRSLSNKVKATPDCR